MRALRQGSFGGPGDLALVEVPVPVAGYGEVLVRVEAAGVNFADVMQTRGTYDGGPVPPYVAGFEAAGVVVEVGESVDPGLVGTRVVGAGSGAFAEFVVMAANGVALVPEGWRAEQGLGMVLNWATALAALKPLGRLRSGETVLVQAAAGGVGQAAVRMAKHYGATVIGAASAAKHDVVRALGADRVVEYGEVGGVRGVDLVLESVGGEGFEGSLAAARRVTGRVVVFGAAAGVASVSNWELVFKHQVQVMGLHIGSMAREAPEVYADVLRELDVLRREGVYVPGEPTVYDLAEGPAVLAALEAGRTVGKLALRP
ncbi:NADPH:quinone reductase-like Zn-dependent oxidoreductase [Saccharothrix variisporea]|uniref:NADPH:quinone reductase-like Zn-dependent oxidoreductase n=2 Tax=Saccharothrix variisporea TaxID=543527 RepID=A0A495X7N1_9PSEU|nr:NADPH:quinone reductase-like Zn-dependent oxidoreductase [Saccharothrix variisporea]